MAGNVRREDIIIKSEAGGARFPFVSIVKSLMVDLGIEYLERCDGDLLKSYGVGFLRRRDLASIIQLGMVRLDLMSLCIVVIIILGRILILR